jgi:cation:H+ antiporter
VIPQTLLLLTGLFLVVKGGDLFVAAAVRLAELLRMPRVVIGSTLVSLATTTPELVVSITAGSRGESGLAVGNAVGSVICNTGLIVGITAILRQVEVHPRSLRVPLGAMFSAGAALFLMTLDLTVSRWQGGLLLAAGSAYFICDFVAHWRDRKPADVREATALEQERSASPWAWLETGTGTGIQFVLGAFLVVLGSRFLVDGAVGVAGRLGIPSIILGLTVIALGTSLPELVTAITSSRQSFSDLALGNVLGANIANLKLIVGTAALIQDVGLSRLTQVLNFPAMLVVMALLLGMLLTDRRITRREGAVLLGSYGLYLAVLVILTIWEKRPCD